MGSSSFLAFYLVVHQPCNAETNACLQPYNPFHFYKIGTRADANIHKAIACRYLSNLICTVVGEWTHDYFCLGYFDTRRPVDTVGSEGVAALCSGSCARDRYCHAGNCTGLTCEHWPFSFTGNRCLFLLQRQLIPFNSLPLLLFQFSRAWRQSSVIEVSDLYSSSPLFSTFDNWGSISSDESPCRTSPMRL